MNDTNKEEEGSSDEEKWPLIKANIKEICT